MQRHNTTLCAQVPTANFYWVLFPLYSFESLHSQSWLPELVATWLTGQDLLLKGPDWSSYIIKVVKELLLFQF